MPIPMKPPTPWCFPRVDQLTSGAWRAFEFLAFDSQGWPIGSAKLFATRDQADEYASNLPCVSSADIEKYNSLMATE